MNIQSHINNFYLPSTIIHMCAIRLLMRILKLNGKLETSTMPVSFFCNNSTLKYLNVIQLKGLLRKCRILIYSFLFYIQYHTTTMKVVHMDVCSSMFAVFWVDGCVTWKVLGNWKWRPSMEHAWKSLLRNVTFFWLLSQGWAKKKKKAGRRGGTNWFEENYTIVNGATAAHKRTPQKAYRFKHTLTVEGDQWCVGEANWEWLLVSTTCVE